MMTFYHNINKPTLFLSGKNQVCRYFCTLKTPETKYIVDLCYNFLGCTTSGSIYKRDVDAITYFEKKSKCTYIFDIGRTIYLLFSSGSLHCVDMKSLDYNVYSKNAIMNDIQCAFEISGKLATIDKNNTWKCDDMMIKAHNCAYPKIIDFISLRGNIITTKLGIYKIHKLLTDETQVGYDWVIEKITEKNNFVDAMLLYPRNIICLDNAGSLWKINLKSNKCKILQHSILKYFKVVKLLNFDGVVCFQTTDCDIYSIDNQYKIGSMHKYNKYYTL